MSQLRIKNKDGIRHLSRGAAPGNEMKTKIMKLTVECGADFKNKGSLLNGLNYAILDRGLYAQMPPVDLGKGIFEVVPGYEHTFKSLAHGYGFNASEVMEC